jgi:hypothetical protein
MDRPRNNAELLPVFHIRSGTDKRDLDLAPLEERVHLVIGPPVDHLDGLSDPAPGVVDDLLVILDRVDRRDHRRHAISRSMALQL